MTSKIKIYGTERCHKTKYYQEFLKDKNVDFTFLYVEKNEGFAQELKGLYESEKLNFPTITIGSKNLRNPSKEELEKRLNNCTQRGLSL